MGAAILFWAVIIIVGPLLFVLWDGTAHIHIPGILATIGAITIALLVAARRPRGGLREDRTAVSPRRRDRPPAEARGNVHPLQTAGAS
jgi:hypothetical protein